MDNKNKEQKAKVYSYRDAKLNRNRGTVAYMRPHINFTRELLASSARVRDNIGVFSIKIIGRSQRTSRVYQIVSPPDIICWVQHLVSQGLF